MKHQVIFVHLLISNLFIDTDTNFANHFRNWVVIAAEVA